MRKNQVQQKKVNESAPVGYVLIATVQPDGKSRILSANGMVVLFDTVVIAQQFIPLMGTGRQTHFSKDGETVWWTPLRTDCYNQAVIITGYDPYNVPANFTEGVRSEVKGREWKGHVMWTHAFLDVGQHVQKDGKVINTALPEIYVPEGTDVKHLRH